MDKNCLFLNKKRKMYTIFLKMYLFKKYNKRHHVLLTFLQYVGPFSWNVYIYKFQTIIQNIDRLEVLYSILSFGRKNCPIPNSFRST